MSKWMDIGRRMTEAEKDSPEAIALHALGEAQRLYEAANDDLLRQAARIKDRVERTAKAVEEGLHVNNLGELQSAGPDFDRLCAIRHERVDRLAAALHLTRQLGVELSDEEVF